MYSKKSKWLALAALLMFVGAVFQIANEQLILGFICFGAAAGFTTSAKSVSGKSKERKTGKHANG